MLVCSLGQGMLVVKHQEHQRMECAQGEKKMVNGKKLMCFKLTKVEAAHKTVALPCGCTH